MIRNPLQPVRCRHSSFIVLQYLAAALVLVTLSGCYATHFQIFGREDSIALPGLEGRYLQEMDGKTASFTVSRSGRGNDYRYYGQDPEEKHPKHPFSGVFRVIRVTDDIYIAQFAPGSRLFDGNSKPSDAFVHVFFRITRSGDTIARIEQLDTAANSESKKALEETILEIAQRDRIDIWSDGGLSGSPKALKRFLLDVAIVPLPTAFVFTRMR